MSNLNISQLPQTVTVSGPELMPLMQGGITKYSVANDIPLNTFKNTNMATTVQVAAVSAGLDTRTTANANGINTLFSTYANSTTVAAISAGLDTRITSNRNDINTLFSTYANSATVAAISGGLQNSLNTLFSTYANSATVAAISAGLQTQETASKTGVLRSTFNGNGNVPGVGAVGVMEVPFACTIQQVSLTSDVPGTATVDIRSCTYANFTITPPATLTSSSSIVGLGNTPTLGSVGNPLQATTLSPTGWTLTSFNKGDWLQFYLNGATLLSWLQVSLKVTRTP